MTRYAVSLSLVALCALGAAGCTTESGDGVKDTPSAGTSSGRPATPKPSASRSASAAAVKKYGSWSKECSSAQLVMGGAARVGLRAAVGKVTESDVADTWTADVIGSLPSPASEVSERLRERAVGFVGMDADTAKPMIAGYSAALRSFTTMVTTMCSAPPPPPKPKVTPTPSGSGASTSAKPSPSPSRS